MDSSILRVNFIVLWTALLLAKLLLASRLPLFVDEAFYAWEGQFPAWAYSDLPGLTAFLTRLGAGHGPIGLRLPFLLLGSAIPWLVASVARRWFGTQAGWWAGLLSLLMPLSGLLGVLALPDVPLVFAALLCLEAVSRLRESMSWGGLAALALALVVGALSHYRFALVVLAGLVGLLLDARGRELLKQPKVWLVLALGLAAWLPLLSWNIENAGAGLRFQVLDRNPWSFHGDGALWLPIQLLLLTPVLFLLLAATLREAWRRREVAGDTPWRLLLGIASVSVVGYFLLGFFVDDQRVSFHWPLSGWLALVVAAPVVLARWGRPARIALLSLSGAGLVTGLAFLCAASNPHWRSSLAGSRAYPGDFAGWPEISRHVRRLRLSDASWIVASDFELAAQLAFALDRREIHVLDSPLNHKHGRAAQLQAWGLQFDDPAQVGAAPVLLVVDDTATSLKLRLRGYHRLCETFGTLPVPAVVSADHGRKRYLVYRLQPGVGGAACAPPAIAWIDSPLPRSRVPARFEISGWAFKDGAGISRVEVTVDGRPMATAAYGAAMPHVRDYWKISTDPNQPKVGFTASVDASGLRPGAHWLGLTLHGADGSVEPWPEQLVRIQAQ